MLCLLIEHSVLLLKFTALQNPWYLHIATMFNQADIVEYALSLGKNAAETDNASRVLQTFHSLLQDEHSFEV